MDLLSSDIRIENKLPDHSGKQKNIKVIVNRVKILWKKPPKNFKQIESYPLC